MFRNIFIKFLILLVIFIKSNHTFDLVNIGKNQANTITKQWIIKWFEENIDDVMKINDQQLRLKLKKELALGLNKKIDQKTFNELFRLITTIKTRKISSLLALKWLQKNKNNLDSMNEKQLKLKLKQELILERHYKIDEQTFNEVLRLILKEKNRIFAIKSKFLNFKTKNRLIYKIRFRK